MDIPNASHYVNVRGSRASRECLQPVVQIGSFRNGGNRLEMNCNAEFSKLFAGARQLVDSTIDGDVLRVSLVPSNPGAHSMVLIGEKLDNLEEDLIGKLGQGLPGPGLDASTRRHSMVGTRSP